MKLQTKWSMITDEITIKLISVSLNKFDETKKIHEIKLNITRYLLSLKNYKTITNMIIVLKNTIF